MKAIVITAPNQLEIAERPMPELKADTDVLVRVRAGGICGSDIHAYHGRNAFVKYPRIMGHEMSAEVVETGAAVNALVPGDHVVLDPVTNCGHCHACLLGRGNVCENLLVNSAHIDGAFAEYCVFDQHKLHKIDKSVPWEIAAMVEPFTIAAQSTHRGRLCKDDDVLVVGAGPIGQVLVQTVKAAGAVCTVTDMVPQRLLLARENGADYTYNAGVSSLTDILRERGIPGFTLCFDAAGIPSMLQTILDATRSAGRVVLLGFSTDPSPIKQVSVTGRELDIIGSRLSYDQFPRVVKWVENGDVNPARIITHRFPFQQVLEGIHTIESEPETCMKVVLTF